MSTTDAITCHHGLGAAHPWEPGGHCPPQPVDPAPDTEHDERLREARAVAEHFRRATVRGWGRDITADQRRLVVLDAEVARQAAVIQGVRDLHHPIALTSGQVACPACTHRAAYPSQYVDYPCPTVRALDGAEQ